MPIDREAALKKAEKLLRQGKLDGAIEEYVRLIEEQPRDWNSINALGDLYVRAGNAERAVAQFVRVADHLFTEGFLPKAAALYKKALKVQPKHEHTLSQLAEVAVRQGVFVDARAYLRQLSEERRQKGDEHGVAECVRRLRALEEPEAAWAPDALTVESAGDDPARLFALARQELASGDELQARASLTRVLTLDPGRHGEVVNLALELAGAGRVESAFGCLEVVTDAALLENNWAKAIDALQAFVAAAPYIPALVKLVELCVDAGLDAPMRSAQARLADAYLDTGKGAEARVIAEDLLEHDPDSDAHAQRVRRALDLLGVSDADTTIAEIRERHDVPMNFEIGEQTAPLPDSVEVDLTGVLTDIGKVTAVPTTQPAAGGDPFVRALAAVEAGRVDEAIADFEEGEFQVTPADRRARVKVAAALGHLYFERDDMERAVEWLERAADGPAATPQDGFAVLYMLADALERLGEPARALAILVDLHADAGEYRDLRARIEHLSRAQAGAPAARTVRGGVEPGSRSR